MDVISSDKNVGIGGLNRKGVQPPQEEVARTPEKTEAGTSIPQGDRVELSSVLPKKDEGGVQGFAQQQIEPKYEQMIAQMKDLIANPSGQAVEAQAGSGKAFLQAIYQ